MLEVSPASLAGDIEIAEDRLLEAFEERRRRRHAENTLRNDGIESGRANTTTLSPACNTV